MSILENSEGEVCVSTSASRAWDMVRLAAACIIVMVRQEE